MRILILPLLITVALFSLAAESSVVSISIPGDLDPQLSAGDGEGTRVILRLGKQEFPFPAGKECFWSNLLVTPSGKHGYAILNRGTLKGWVALGIYDFDLTAFTVDPKGYAPKKIDLIGVPVNGRISGLLKVSADEMRFLINLHHPNSPGPNPTYVTKPYKVELSTGKVTEVEF